MSYELKKPYSNQQRVEFLEEYKTLSFAETDLYLFALEANEMMGEKEIEIEVVDPETGETHIETITIPYPVINPDYEQEQAARREAEFNKAFFNTSLGYIRRSVSMSDGSKKDFLSDLVLSIKAGLEQGLNVKILAYDKPPFDEDVTDWTEYQHAVFATPQFIQECLMQTANDFLPINEEENEDTTDQSEL